MEDEELSPRSDNAKSPSYREVLKPKTTQEKQREERRNKEEVWDGSLLFIDYTDLKEGVKVRETEAGVVIEFSEDERRRLEEKWSNSLIIKLLGGSIGFMTMRRKVRQMWGKSGNVDLSDIGNGYLIATFKDLGDYYFALEGGPWMVQNHYPTVQTWKRNFNPWNESIKRVAIWVWLPGLPDDYYDKKFFYHLGNKIGKAIRVDDMNLNRVRTMYARICVEVDLAAPLLPLYEVDGNALRIEYEGLQLICFNCGKFRHIMEQCPPKKKTSENQGNDVELTRSQLNEKSPESMKKGGETANKFRQWMVAQYPRRGRKPMRKKIKRKGKKV